MIVQFGAVTFFSSLTFCNAWLGDHWENVDADPDGINETKEAYAQQITQYYLLIKFISEISWRNILFFFNGFS